MSDVPKYIIGIIIGVLIVGGLVMIFMNPSNNATNTTDNSSDAAIQDQSSSSGNILNSNSGNAANGSSSQGSQGGSIIGGGVEQNSQEGQGQFYQINYSDGNFRQYDTKTGELIGSTFDEDQAKLRG